MEEDTVRLRMAATSLESAKQVGQKKAENLEEKLKKVTEHRNQLEKELKELKAKVGSLEEEVASLKQNTGEEMQTEPAPPVKRKPFAKSMIAVGDKTMAPLRDDVHLWEELGGIGAFGMWSAYQDSITSCCDRVRRYMEEETEGSIHVFIMSGAQDVRDGVPIGLTSQNIAKAIATALVILRRYSDRVLSIQLCSMVEHPDCPNIAEVNDYMKESVEVIRGEFDFIDLRNISRDRRFVDVNAKIDDPYKATYTREGYEVIKKLLKERFMARLSPDENTHAKILENREMLMAVVRQKEQAKLERQKQRKEKEEERLRKLRTAAVEESRNRPHENAPKRREPREHDQDRGRRQEDNRRGRTAPYTRPRGSGARGRRPQNAPRRDQPREKPGHGQPSTSKHRP